MDLFCARVVSASPALAFPQLVCVSETRVWIHGRAQRLPPVTPSRVCAPSTWHRRDCTDGCHLLLSHRAGIWPCSLLQSRRYRSNQHFCYCHPRKWQFSEGLRGGTEKRIVLCKPLHGDLHLVKSQVCLQRWKSVGSPAVHWVYSLFCPLFISGCLFLFSEHLTECCCSCGISPTCAHLLHVSGATLIQRGCVCVKPLKESASCHLCLPRISFLVQH